MAYDKTKLFEKGAAKGTPDINVLKSMYIDAYNALDMLSTHWDTMDSFFDGEQWDSVLNQGSDGMKSLVKSDGTPVYGLHIGKGMVDDDGQLVQRTINKYKSYMLSTTALFSEVDPMPNAYSLSSYNYDESKLDKPNLVLYNGFRLENDFKEIYSNIVIESMQKGYSVLHMYKDEDNSDTEIPIKFRLIDPKDFLVDSHATNINTAQFVIVKEKMRWWEFNEKFIQMPHPLNGKDVEENEDMTVVEVLVYWVKVGKSKWYVIHTHNDTYLKLKDKDGKAIKDTAYIRNILPYVVYRPVNNKKWYGVSVAIDAIELQIDYNKTRSEQDVNWMKYVDPPAGLRAIAPDKYKEGNQPGGTFTYTPETVIQPFPSPLIPAIESGQRLAVIESDFGQIFGNQDLFSGRNPQGTYSNVHLETLIALQQMKPKMFEENYFKSIRRTAKLYLEMVSESLTSKLSLFNPTTQKNVEISRDDINVQKFKFEVRVQDMKLMTPQKKFDNFIQTIQYYPQIIESLGAYNVAKLANSAMSGFFPPDVIDRLKTDDEAMQKMKEMQIKSEMQKMEQPEQGQSPASTGTAPPPTGAGGEPQPASLNNEEQQVQEPDEITALAAEINDLLDENGAEIRNYIIESGYSDTLIEDIMKEADESGKPPEELLDDLTAIKSKVLEIKERYQEA